MAKYNMLQVKIFANKKTLDGCRGRISAAIHESVTKAMDCPGIRPNHRFFPLEPYDFIYPDDRSDRYLILEITMLEGNPAEMKKKLMKLLFLHLEEMVALTPRDLEIIINETSGQNWWIRGRAADESAIIHKMEV